MPEYEPRTPEKIQALYMGRPVDMLSREELIEAVITLGELYNREVVGRVDVPDLTPKD